MPPTALSEALKFFDQEDCAMEGWKEDIDRRLKKKEEAKRKRRSRRAEKAMEADKRREREMLERHRQKYRCHICGEQSSGPSYETGDWDAGKNSTYYPIWNKPVNLSQCKRCEKWVCVECSHNGYCKKCANKI